MAEQVSKRSIVYEILIDMQQGKKSVADAEKAIEEFTKEVNGAATGVEKFAKSTEASVGRLRQLKTQLNNFKGSQKDFEALSLEAARLQDQLDKTNRRIRTLASSTRQIEALASGVQGLVGVFTAAQGAAALFGSENKNLQQAILRVQGALALLQGVQAAVATITEQSAFKTVLYSNALKVYEFVTKGATLATRLFNAALVASIGGAIIAGLVLLVSKWRDIAEAIGLAKTEQEDLNKATDDFFSKNKQATDRIRANIDITKRSTKEINEEITRLKNQLDDIPKEGVEVIFNGKVIKQNLDETRRVLNEQLKRLQDEIQIRTTDIKKSIEDVAAVEVGRADVGLFDEKAIAERREAEERLIKLEDQRRGIVVKTAEVERTAHEQLMADMMDEEEQRKRLMTVIQQSAIIFNNLAQLARDNSDAQLGLSIASVIAANAEALAKGVASAAAVPFPGNLPAIFSTIATITGVFASIKNLSEQAKAAQSSTRVQAAQRFAEGTPYLDDRTAPHGKDTIPIYANRGEAIIPTEENLKAPGLAAAWINGNLEDYINVNYVSPALAAKTIQEIERDSALDYSNRFYKQLLATAEGNQINKKALKYLNSIDVKLGKNIPSRYA